VLLKTSRQERAADKSIRLFAQLDQKGFRSTATLLLSGHDAEGWVVPRPSQGAIWRRISVVNVTATTADAAAASSASVLRMYVFARKM
jgi:hypothetical protein